MALKQFPKFKFQSWRPYIDGQATTGGRSTSGQVQTVKTDGGGRWFLEPSDANLNAARDLKAWRAFEGLLDGGATEVEVFLCDKRNAPVLTIGGKPFYGADQIPHGDDTLFDDDTGYAQGSGVVAISGSAPLRATVLTLSTLTAGDMTGSHFSIRHPGAGLRLYRVVEVDGMTIRIRPPLREAISAGQALDFDDPGCVVRLVTESAPDFAPSVLRHRYARGSAKFMESFDYAG